ASFSHFQTDQRTFYSGAFSFLQRIAADELLLFHFAEAIQPSVPDINRIGNLVAVERELAFEPQRIPSAQAARHDPEFLTCNENLVPDECAGTFVRWNVDFEAILGGVTRTAHQSVLKPAHSAARDPVELHRAQVRVRELLQQIHVFAEAMHDDIIHKGSLGIEQRRILRLADRQPRGIVHGNSLNCGEGLSPGEADVAHVADIKDADARAHGHVLVDDAATKRSGIFDGHIPSIEFHHLRAHLAMDNIERSFSNGGRLYRRQDRPQTEQWLAAGMV